MLVASIQACPLPCQEAQVQKNMEISFRHRKKRRACKQIDILPTLPTPKLKIFTLTPCCTRNICCFLCPPTKMHLKNAFLSPNLLECILAIGTHLVFSDAFNALTNQFGISRQKCLGRRSLEISSLKMFRLQCRLF